VSVAGILGGWAMGPGVVSRGLVALTGSVERSLLLFEGVGTSSNCISLTGTPKSALRYARRRDNWFERSGGVVVGASEGVVVLVGARDGEVVLVGASEGVVVLVGARDGEVVLVGASEGVVVLVGVRDGEVVLVGASEGVVVLVGARDGEVVLVGAREAVVLVRGREAVVLVGESEAVVLVGVTGPLLPAVVLPVELPVVAPVVLPVSAIDIATKGLKFGK
jgi:hypothetical protein